MSKIIFILLMPTLLVSCLKTRADLSEQEQSRFYGKKNAENQSAGQSQLNANSSVANNVVDERDDLIRGFNGRIESLENQITTLQKEKAALTTSADTQKLQLLQDALVKMEAQIQKLEAEATAASQSSVALSPAVTASKPGHSTTKKETSNLSAYDSAQDFFSKKEWKKAILCYQKYVDENSKGKNTPDSKYKIGVCFQELGMKEEAMAFYEEVIANYGKTESGKKAKIRLSKLKK